MSALEADKRAALQLRHLIGNNYRAWSQPAGCTPAAHRLTEYLVLIEDSCSQNTEQAFILYMSLLLFLSTCVAGGSVQRRGRKQLVFNDNKVES